MIHDLMYCFEGGNEVLQMEKKVPFFMQRKKSSLSGQGEIKETGKKVKTF